MAEVLAEQFPKVRSLANRAVVSRFFTEVVLGLFRSSDDMVFEIVFESLTDWARCDPSIAEVVRVLCLAFYEAAALQKSEVSIPNMSFKRTIPDHLSPVIYRCALAALDNLPKADLSAFFAKLCSNLPAPATEARVRIQKAVVDLARSDICDDHIPQVCAVLRSTFPESESVQLQACLLELLYAESPHALAKMIVKHIDGLLVRFPPSLAEYQRNLLQVLPADKIDEWAGEMLAQADAVAAKARSSGSSVDTHQYIHGILIFETCRSQLGALSRPFLKLMTQLKTHPSVSFRTKLLEETKESELFELGPAVRSRSEVARAAQAALQARVGAAARATRTGTRRRSETPTEVKVRAGRMVTRFSRSSPTATAAPARTARLSEEMLHATEA